GKMTALGWTASMEKDKTLVTTAPRDNADPLAYEAFINNASAIEEYYRYHLMSLIPAVGSEFLQSAMELGTPSFASELHDLQHTRAFANSITITDGDFSNYLHCDQDHVPIAFGIWFMAKKNGRSYEVSTTIPHSSVCNGEFIWGRYGIGVDFSHCNGPVEIFWRGSMDEHATMSSTSIGNATRFGTSIQITRRGTQAM
ncbi:hypothetical protein CALCODRAFT_417995, partial [Calocera cornea HHB12733]